MICEEIMASIEIFDGGHNFKIDFFVSILPFFDNRRLSEKILSDICAVKIRLHYIMQTGMRSCFFREIFFRTEEPIRVVS